MLLGENNKYIRRINKINIVQKSRDSNFDKFLPNWKDRSELHGIDNDFVLDKLLSVNCIERS